MPDKLEPDSPKSSSRGRSGSFSSNSGYIKLTNNGLPLSEERVRDFWKSWKLQWEQGDHVAPNIALFSVLAGALIGSGLAATFFVPAHRTFGLYLLSLGIFHLSEYLTTAVFNPRRVKLDSFMYDPVTGYQLALGASFLEYVVKKQYYSNLYAYVVPIQAIGFFITIVGQWFRTRAMVEASTSFNHHVASMKDHDHILITSGIFSIVRHPSYLGFYMFTLGSQMMLFNPICFLAFAYVLHQFFSSRIRTEEVHLIRFFGTDYRNYRDNTPTYLPFIS